MLKPAVPLFIPEIIPVCLACAVALTAGDHVNLCLACYGAVFADLKDPRAWRAKFAIRVAKACLTRAAA